MSVDRTTYLLYGFKFTSEEEMDKLDEHYEELVEKEPYRLIFNDQSSDQITVWDGMCGEYIYVGIRIAEIDGVYSGEEGYVEISEKDLENLKPRLDGYMESWPPYLLDLCRDHEPKLYLFVHIWQL